MSINQLRVVLKVNEKSSSLVWTDFRLIYIDDTFSSYIKCLKCSNVLKWKFRDGTSGLKCHLFSCVKSKLEAANVQRVDQMSLFPITKKPETSLPQSVNSLESGKSALTSIFFVFKRELSDLSENRA